MELKRYIKRIQEVFFPRKKWVKQVNKKMIVFAYVFAIYSIMNIEEVISSGLPVL